MKPENRSIPQPVVPSQSGPAPLASAVNFICEVGSFDQAMQAMSQVGEIRELS